MRPAFKIVTDVDKLKKGEVWLQLREFKNGDIIFFRLKPNNSLPRALGRKNSITLTKEQITQMESDGNIKIIQ